MAERDRPEDRDVVGHEVAAGEAIWTSHQMFHACSDRIGKMSFWYSARLLQVVRAARRPRMNGSHSDDDDRQRRSRPSGAISRHPPCAQNQAANGRRNGRACGLVISATRQGRRGQPVAAVQTAKTRAASADQQVDALVLAPPGADVDDGRVEQDDRGGHRRAQNGFDAERVDHQQPRVPRSASEAGIFISARIAGSELSVDGPERRLDGAPARPRCRP